LLPGILIDLVDVLVPIVVLHSSLSELDFKGLAIEESYAWKKIEQVMNEARNKLGSNSILEYKVCFYLTK
jgi:hypothetical protein